MFSFNWMAISTFLCILTFGINTIQPKFSCFARGFAENAIVYSYFPKNFRARRGFLLEGITAAHISHNIDGLSEYLYGNLPIYLKM